MTTNTPRRYKAAAPGGLSNVAARREAIEAAELELQRAMVDAAPACEGDERFTSDDRVGLEREFALGLVCESCPLCQACAGYATAARPEAGFWAGEWHGPKSRDRDTETGANFPAGEVTEEYRSA